jgi:hypothetical protein
VWETSDVINTWRAIPALLGFSLILAACSSTQNVGEYEIVTLLPKDAIRSIDQPRFYSVVEANAEYADDEQVLGVTFDGEARAYSVGLLSNHEIVNDHVGGHPIAVTW